MSFHERIATLFQAGPAFSNSNARNDLWVDGDEFVTPAGLFSRTIEKELNLAIVGIISTLNAAPGTVTFDVQFGGVTVWSSGAIPLNVVAKTNEPFRLDVTLSGRQVGSGTNGKVIGFGEFKSHAILGAPAQTAGGTPSFLLPYNTTPGVLGGGFDTRYSQEVSVGATFSVASPSNAIQATQGWANILAS